ncbi:MAG: WecB/TagA/CpsF family glycosyltransferase [Pseudomonadota bacterium]
MSKLEEGANFKYRPIAGYSVLDGRPETVADALISEMNKGARFTVAFFNSRLVVKLKELRRDASRYANFLFLNDGVAASAASVVSNGQFLRHNLNGTDFTPLLLSRLPRGTRVFLYGGKVDVVRQAAEVIAERTEVDVVGYMDGYTYRDAAVAQQISHSRPDVVLVALGNPLQEDWMADHGPATGARLVLGVGALFDFLSETVSRAPKWVRAARLEWAYRLLLEPRRMLRRYTLDSLYFFWLVLRMKGRTQTVGLKHIGTAPVAQGFDAAA